MNSKLADNKQENKKYINHNGFTLIEVVIGISILSILFGMCHGVITKYMNIYNYYDNSYRLEYELYWIYKSFDALVNDYNKNLSEIKINKKGNLPETAIYEDYYTENVKVTYFRDNAMWKLIYNGKSLIRFYQIENIEGYLENQMFYLIITDKEGNRILKVYYLCGGS